MIQIDIDADLNMVDDDDRNFARRPKDVSRLAVGRVAVAGRPGFWSWVMIDDVGDTAVYFHQISDAEAAALRSGDAAYSAVTESGTLLRYEPIAVSDESTVVAEFVPEPSKESALPVGGSPRGGVHRAAPGAGVRVPADHERGCARGEPAGAARGAEQD